LKKSFGSRIPIPFSPGIFFGIAFGNRCGHPTARYLEGLPVRRPHHLDLVPPFGVFDVGCIFGRIYRLFFFLEVAPPSSFGLFRGRFFRIVFLRRIMTAWGRSFFLSFTDFYLKSPPPVVDLGEKARFPFLSFRSNLFSVLLLWFFPMRLAVIFLT